jgi:multisubunit Na+/H+ antiporter MnhF subunit
MNTNDMAIILLTGAGATAVTDLWTLLRRRMFGTPLPNFSLVGRWIAHMTRGRFRHAPIAAAAPVRAERLIGWSTHYLIGMAFALLLPAFWGAEWVRDPTLLPALIVGVGTVAAPFFVMQPAMGMKPSRVARLHSLVMHAVFGFGLYLAGKVIGSLLNGE